MKPKNQIITILFLSIVLGLCRYFVLSDPDFTLIKKERVIKEITSFTVPEVMTEPMSISIEFAKFLFDSKSAIFIDARDVEDFESGRIRDAINIPFDYYEDYQEVIENLNVESVYVIYCNGEECSLSMDLADYLFNEHLFEKVLIYEGGWPEWRDKGYPS